MDKIRRQFQKISSLIIQLPVIITAHRSAIFIATLLWSVYFAGGITVERLELKSDKCPVSAECNVSFEKSGNPSEIKQEWFHNGKLVEETKFKSTEDLDSSEVYYHYMPCTVKSFGNLTCKAVFRENGVESDSNETVEVMFSMSPMITNSSGGKVKMSESGLLICTAEGNPAPDIEWYLNNELISSSDYKRQIKHSSTPTSSRSELHINNTQRFDNGSYWCRAFNEKGKDEKSAILYVQAKPEVFVETALGVGAQKIYLSWSLNDGNLLVLRYNIKYLKEGTEQWFFGSNLPNVSSTNYVITGLEPDTSYRISLEAENVIGKSNLHEYDQPVKTLVTEPDYKPEVNVKGSTFNSITLGWTAPPTDLRHLIGHFIGSYGESPEEEGQTIKIPLTEERLPDHMFIDLKPATKYYFKVKACHKYLDHCGQYSDPVDGTTMDGRPSEPVDVKVICEKDENTQKYYATATWQAPAQPNGQLVRYLVKLKGIAKYLNDRRQEETDHFGPMVQFVDSSKFSFRFDDIPPNTNYTVQVSGETRTPHLLGYPAEAVCQIPTALPDKEVLNNVSWSRYRNVNTWEFSMNLPRLSERRGPICCYAIIIVKLSEGESVASLPEPSKIKTSSYRQVHQKGRGAYVAEIFDANSVPERVYLGDKMFHNTTSCSFCNHLFTSEAPSSSPSEVEDTPASITESTHGDGVLDETSSYTAFLEIFTTGSDGEKETAYSRYTTAMTPRANTGVNPSDDQSEILVVALGILCGLAVVLLVIVTAILLLRRYSKHVAQVEGVEMSLGSSFRHLWRRFRDGRHLLVPVPSASASPISRCELVQAYIERHQNTDYGFQHEYEMLPERFADRTTRASDTRENIAKNRYPDIKAYDQTRVKLNMINCDPNSDYINANIVMGYKERKKFICAQGPMESTVFDFWRMAWEQRVEIIVMLTNVEEYNKTKCFQYWPDPDPLPDIPTPEPLYVDPVSENQSNGGLNHSPSNGSLPEVTMKGQREKLFGDIRVLHVKEKRYSEYVVRELQVSRPKAHTPTDPELAVMEREVRPVFQYHYLVWKDFQAPEHATGILRFLRRLNDDYSTDRGPILIHCSAGVGRTGTLVAIDHLIQQVEEEGCVSVFNTVCDLRHQRNFLVQSLRQYIFVYRALMEWVQFGNTEILTANFQDTLRNLRMKLEGRNRTLLEEEFDKLSQVVEDRKPLSVASSEENRLKNRHETALPLDRNRSMLTPILGRDFSTYINASHIEGYDNSESFIITQDPLETTIKDFWRMVFEHNVAIIVMLSETGSESWYCPQYWPSDEQEIAHDHLSVKHVSSTTYPYYIQREFLLRNTKNREEVRINQIQFLGWKMTENALEDNSVPSSQQVAAFVSVALETLAARNRPRINQLHNGTACVHCSTGSLRSSVLLALCILIEQARTEGFVDVFSTVRKLRSQRSLMIQHFTHYAFIYEALAYYLKTHPASLPSTP